MPSLRVQIVRFVDEAFPGFIELQFRDADGQLHRSVEKIPVVTRADLWSDSEYPQPCSLECKIVERTRDANGRKLLRITIAEPWGVETIDGRSEFLVNEADISDEP